MTNKNKKAWSVAAGSGSVFHSEGFNGKINVLHKEPIKAMKKQGLNLRSTPNSILIISMRYLGDVILITPLIRTIKCAYPDAKIDVFVYAHTAGMLEGNSDIREVIVTSQDPKCHDYVFLLKKIFRQYDLSIVTQTSDRLFLYGLLSAPIRIGFVPPRSEKAWWKRFFMQGWVEFDNVGHHAVLDFLELSNTLNIPPQFALIPPKPIDFTSPSDFKINDDYAIVHVYPQWTYKQWHFQGWIEIGEYLEKKGLKIILSGGTDEKEKVYIDAVQQQLPKSTINLSGKVSLADLSHIISHAKLFVGPDTGITHLAAATGVPVIALFGPTNPVKWGPWPIRHNTNLNPFSTKGSQHVGNIFLVQGEGNCVPCYQEGCDGHRQSRSSCLDNLSSNNVINCIDRALAPSQKNG